MEYIGCFSLKNQDRSEDRGHRPDDEEPERPDPPPFEYEGHTYTHYEATQKQREIERAVRKWKRREAAATDPADKQSAQIRIRILKQKYEEFSKAANLRT